MERKNAVVKWNDTEALLMEYYQAGKEEKYGKIS